jgi:hypothetical protein
MKRRCPKCSAEWESKGPIGFREECPDCAVFLHTCTNCRVFDARKGGCRSPTTEPVTDIQAINFCEEFDFGPGGDPGGIPPTPKAPKAAAPPSTGKPASADDARKRFENLFRDPKQ